jgi:cytochrome c oxidase subunit IV
MTAHLRNLLLTWVLLLVLLAAVFGASFLPLERIERPLILIPVGLMVMTVGTMFMQVGRGPLIVRLFVVAGLVWLGILLGLGSLDPMTRTDYLVQTANPN